MGEIQTPFKGIAHCSNSDKYVHKKHHAAYTDKANTGSTETYIEWSIYPLPTSTRSFHQSYSSIYSGHKRFHLDQNEN